MSNKAPLFELLHINSYYIDNHLYKTFFRQLDSEYTQKIYIPIKKNRNEEHRIALKEGALHYAKVIKRRHTVFYFSKINVLVKDLVRRELHKSVDLIHAHNLFVDGGAAYELKRKYGIRYIVSIRMTDIALQYKYMIHRRNYARKILEEAEYVIFISPLYKNLLYAYFKPAFRDLLEAKTKVIPNGIDGFWFNESAPRRSLAPQYTPIKLLYVGQLIKRKNIEKLIEATSLLNSRQPESVTLTLIGGSHPDEADYFHSIKDLVQATPSVNYLGKINDQEILRSKFRSHDIFVMPSKKELFGLVYIEALSQNLPVIYSKNEGISPYLNSQFLGEEVDPDNSTAIAEGINQLINEYTELKDMSTFAKKFNWPDIIEQYKEIYNLTINEQNRAADI